MQICIEAAAMAADAPVDGYPDAFASTSGGLSRQLPVAYRHRQLVGRDCQWQSILSAIDRAFPLISAR